MSKLEIRKIETPEEMLKHLELIRQLSATLTLEEYVQLLKIMIPLGYYQVGVFDGEKCAGISGYWINAKLYSGKYIEIDNFVVDAKYRSKGIGKLLVDWMLEEGRRQGCKTAMLDAYVENFKAHKFYYREGFIARGFHYLKSL